MKKIFVSILIAGIIAIAVFFAAGPCETLQSESGGTFRSYLTSEPANLDPARGVDVNEGTVQSKIFDGLLQYDEEMNLVGNLAHSWEISDDAREFTFKLREGIRFHNGRPLTAADVAYSLDRILDPKVSSPRTWVLEKVEGSADRMTGKSDKVSGITIKDDHTVSIRLSEAFAPFLSLLTMPACYILPSESHKSISDMSFFEKPSGTGPFRIVERQRDSYIRLEANRDYHDRKPMIAAIELRIIPEPLKAEMEFEAGNLDILQLQPSNYDRYANDPAFRERINDVAAMNIYYVGFNNQKAPFNDVRVRKALNMLVDRNAIIKAVFGGRGIPAKGSIPPGISGYSPDAPEFGYDPAAALKLLAEAGFSKDKPLEFDLFQRSSQAAFEITRLIQGELKKHGVIANLKPMEWSALRDAIVKGEPEAFYLSWFADYPDGENFLYPLFHSGNWGSGGNRARFKNEQVDKLLVDALRIQDNNLRAETYDRINRMVADQAPWMYLWHSSESYLVGKNVKSMKFSPLFTNDKGLTTSLNE